MVSSQEPDLLTSAKAFLSNKVTFMVPGIRTWTYHSSKWTKTAIQPPCDLLHFFKTSASAVSREEGTHIPQVDVGSHPCPSPSFPPPHPDSHQGLSTNLSELCNLSSPLVPTAILTGLLSVFQTLTSGTMLEPMLLWKAMYQAYRQVGSLLEICFVLTSPL